MSLETSKSYTKEKDMVQFENEYISVLRVDSSNKWIDKASGKLSKQWGIIIDIKKDFTMLPGYRDLQRNYPNIAVTPVTRGEMLGCYGIRIYDMRQEPTKEIIEDILNYIFQ